METQSSVNAAKDDFKQKTSSLSPENQEILKLFFQTLYEDYNFAYTLFDEKPCSVAGYSFSVLNGRPLSAVSLCERHLLEEGWNCWQQCNKMFPSSNYVMKNLADDPIQYLFLINKSATLKVLKTYLTYVQESLQMHLSAEQILAKICEEDEFLLKCTYHSGVFGILLGYGKVNGDAFSKRAKLSYSINLALLPPFKKSLEGLDSDSLFFVEGYADSLDKAHFRQPNIPPLETLKTELNSLVTSLSSFELFGSDHYIQELQVPLFFAVKNDPETIVLKERYERSRENVIKMYRANPILESTLMQWTSKQPGI